ncbi:MAG TPA: hypothetical protein VJH97_07290 [Candidatus Nanoarchaeia archaeon]|nr:hypothetical protein [Candidatus Nanoarchaeia archaeon]
MQDNRLVANEQQFNQSLAGKVVEISGSIMGATHGYALMPDEIALIIGPLQEGVFGVVATAHSSGESDAVQLHGHIVSQPLQVDGSATLVNLEEATRGVSSHLHYANSYGLRQKMADLGLCLAHKVYPA